jgi:hypothetical protein
MRHFNPGSRAHARGANAEESTISKTICNRYEQDRPINARRPAVVERGGIDPEKKYSEVDVTQQNMQESMFLSKTCLKKGEIRLSSLLLKDGSNSLQITFANIETNGRL